MKIIMDITGGRELLPSTLAKILLDSFSYADTGSADNHMIFHPWHLDHTWESRYGSVDAWKYSTDSTVFVEMETGCKPSLVAKALGVFDHFMHNSSIESHDISITDAGRNINIRVEDLTAVNLYKLIQLTDTSEDWWDENVLPILEKIW